jgi:hypothetical protein
MSRFPLTLAIVLCLTSGGTWLQVKANHEQWKLMRGRVQSLAAPVQKLTTAALQKPETLAALSAMVDTLSDVQKSAAEYAAANWFKRVLKHGSDREMFAEANERLTRAAQALQLGVQIAQLFDGTYLCRVCGALCAVSLVLTCCVGSCPAVKAANEAAAKDRNALSAKQEELLRVQKEVLQVGTDNADLLQVQKRQLVAIQAQLSALLQAQAQSPTAAAGAHKADEMMSARFDDIKFLEVLGLGAFGVVYKVQWRGQIGAAKVCPASLLSSYSSGAYSTVPCV